MKQDIRLVSCGAEQIVRGLGERTHVHVHVHVHTSMHACMGE
jgi:hypothetical protein